MAPEPPSLSVERPPDAPREQPDRLLHLIDALAQLRSRIADVEGRHPRLRDDLSSLCDLAIGHLTRPEVEQVQPAPATEKAEAPVEVASIQLPAAVPPTAPEVSLARRPGPVASAFDKAADGLASGLDRMGDGIIFVIEKLTFRSGSRAGRP